MRILFFILITIAIILFFGTLILVFLMEDDGLDQKKISRKRQKMIEGRINQAFKEAAYLIVANGDTTQEVVVNIEDLSLQEKRVMYDAFVNLCGSNFIKKVEFLDKRQIGSNKSFPQQDSIQLRIKARELVNDF